MIDFWELTGRLSLMPTATRTAEIYENIMPLQANGCIRNEEGCNSPALTFPKVAFYDQLRDYFTTKYQDGKGDSLLFTPAVSMFALGETGTMFFNDKFRKLFDNLSNFLNTSSIMQNRNDLTSDNMFYVALGVLILDSTVRKSVAQSGDFAGVAPESPQDQEALRNLAGTQAFSDLCDAVCFDGEWTEGSVNTLRGQLYPRSTPPGKPHRHIRFIGL